MILNTCLAVLLPFFGFHFCERWNGIRIAIWESLGYFPLEYMKELHGIKNTSAKQM